MTKHCKSCGEDKPATTEFFAVNKGGMLGLHSKCKSCSNEYSRKRYYNNDYKLKRRKNRRDNPEYNRYYSYLNMLYTSYRLREEGFREMMDNQRGCCAICQDSLAKPDHSMNHCHVDHCHTSERVRGLLCGDCNSMLGYAKDEKQILHRAISYLLKGA